MVMRHHTVQRGSSWLPRVAVLLAVTVVATPALLTGPVHAEGDSRADAPARASWWFDKMRLGEAHGEATGRGVQVAVVDSGLDSSVPELEGADISFGRTRCTVPPQMSKNSAGLPGDHGVAMVSLIAGGGAGNDPQGRGIMGVAPDASIRFYDNDTDPDTDGIQCGTYDELAETVRQAVDDGADIVNLSFGSVGAAPSATRIIERLVADEDVVLVAASGEGSGIYEFPASVPGVVSVNAVDALAEPWSENPPLYGGDTKYGFPVISAPGVDVEAPGFYEDGSYTSEGERTGTSDAAAIVSGVLALVKEKYPDASANQLIQHMVHNVGGDVGWVWDRDYGFGIISANNMLAEDPTGWPDVNPLINGPQKATKEFPPSVYGSGDSPDPTPEETPSAASSDAGPDRAEREPTAGGAGALPWLGGGALVAAALAGTVFLARRGRGVDSNQPAPGSMREGE